MALTPEQLESLKRTARTQKGHVTRKIEALERALVAQKNSPTTFGFSECKRIFRELEDKAVSVIASYDALLINDEVDQQNAWEAKSQDISRSVDVLRSEMQVCVSASQAAGVSAQTSRAPAQQSLVPGQYINETLKPEVLSLDNKPIELRQWIRQLRMFFKSNQLEKVSVDEQIGYCRRFLSPELEVLVSTKMDDHTVVDGHHNSMVSLIQGQFDVKYPLFERRLEYFQLQMQQGQAPSAFVAKKIQLSYEADLASLQVDDLNCFMVMMGLKDDALLSKLLDMANPTFEEIKNRITRYESTKASKKACGEAAKVNKVGQVQPKERQSVGQRHLPQFEGMVTPWSLEGKCNRCASQKHRRDKCDKENATCNKCNRKGHIAPACLFEYFRQNDKKDRRWQRNQRPAERARHMDQMDQHEDVQREAPPSLSIAPTRDSLVWGNPSSLGLASGRESVVRGSLSTEEYPPLPPGAWNARATQ